MGPLLDQIPGEIENVTADGAYEGAPIYQLVEQGSKDITVVIPPPVAAVLNRMLDAGRPKSVRSMGKLIGLGYTARFRLDLIRAPTLQRCRLM